MGIEIDHKFPRVVFYSNIPAPYMVERFNALADRCNINFCAWFNDRIESDRSWVVDESKWRFHYHYIETLVVAGKRFHFPLPLLKGCRPDVLVSAYSEVSFLFGWLIAKLKKVRTGFWVEATFDSWIRRTIWKEKFKKWLFPQAEFIITIGRDGRNYSLRYGALRERIFFVPHGIDVVHYSNESAIYKLKRSSMLEQPFKKTTTFIYVGRIVKLKGLNYLLDAFKRVQSWSESKVNLLLVGDGSDEEFFQHRCETEDIKNVLFTGFYQKNELPRMYAAADVFVFPTLGDPYGLVVNEAMACSLPIITTNAVGEIADRVEDGLNGYIVPPENSYALAEAMMKLVKDPKLRRHMGSVSADKIAGHTPEKWAEDFEQIVHSVMKSSYDSSKLRVFV